MPKTTNSMQPYEAQLTPPLDDYTEVQPIDDLDDISAPATAAAPIENNLAAYGQLGGDIEGSHDEPSTALSTVLTASLFAAMSDADAVRALHTDGSAFTTEEHFVLRQGRSAKEHLTATFAPYIATVVDAALQQYHDPDNLHRPHVDRADRLQNGFLGLYLAIEDYAAQPRLWRGWDFAAYARQVIAKIVKQEVIEDPPICEIPAITTAPSLRSLIDAHQQSFGTVDLTSLPIQDVTTRRDFKVYQDIYTSQYTVSLQDVHFPYAALEEQIDAFDVAPTLAIDEVYPDDHRTPVDEVFAALLRPAVWNVLGKLPLDQRLSIVESTMNRRSRQEIARILQQGPHRVKTHLEAGRRKLGRDTYRQMLQGYAKEDLETNRAGQNLSGDRLRTGRGRNRA